MSGPLLTHQRAGHITSDLNRHMCQTWVEAGRVNGCHPGEVGARASQVRAMRIEHARTECNGDTHAAIGGCAATYAHDDACGPLVECRADEIAGAEGAGGLGVAFGIGQPLIPRGMREFHHGRAIRQKAERGGDGPAEWISGRGLHHPAASRGHQGVHGALATIGHRHLNGLVPRLAHPTGDGRCRIRRAKRRLERSGCHDHPQGHAAGGAGGQLSFRNPRRRS